MRFYLGTHKAHWLGLTDVPLFVSRRTLAGRRSLPRARGPWALDSGGFTELSMYGRWSVTPEQYAADVRRFRDHVGGLEWAAPMDWMCETDVLKSVMVAEDLLFPVPGWDAGLPADLRPAKRRRLMLRACPEPSPSFETWRVGVHQTRTIDNFIALRRVAPDLPWIPVLQGRSWLDYGRHAEDYGAAGMDLTREPLVGVGSVCRRQNTVLASLIFGDLADRGIRCHGFGYKLDGLESLAHLSAVFGVPHLASADSLSWSYDARRSDPLPGCPHPRCNNCLRYALAWRARAVAAAQVPDLPPSAAPGPDLFRDCA